MALHVTEWLDADLAAEDVTHGTASWVNQICTVVTSSSPSHYLISASWAGTGSFGVPADATILGLEVDIRRRVASAGKNVTDESVIVTVDSVASTDNHASADAWGATFVRATYGGQTDLWGLTITPATADSLVVSLAIQSSDTLTVAAQVYGDGTTSVGFFRARYWYETSDGGDDDDDELIPLLVEDEMSIRPSSPMAAGLYVDAQTSDPYLCAVGSNAAVRVATVVTLTTTAAHGYTADDIGKPIDVVGIDNTALNGTFALVSVPGPTTLTYATAASGSVTSGNGTVALYPVIELRNGTKLRLAHNISGSGTGGYVTLYSANATRGAQACVQVPHSGDGQSIKSTAQTASYESVYKNCGRYVIIKPTITDMTHTISYEEQV